MILLIVYFVLGSQNSGNVPKTIICPFMVKSDEICSVRSRERPTLQMKNIALKQEIVK